MLVIPIFIPHAGCPNDCVFCNQKTISGHGKQPTSDDIEKTVEIYREASNRYDNVEIAFFGGSFTAINGELQEMYLSTVQKYLKIYGGFVDRIRLSTRPDAIDDVVLRRLLKYNATVVELGAQTMDDDVLKASNRGHDAKATVIASRLIKSYGMTLGLQTMPGLPGSTVESDILTAKKISALNPKIVRIYPTIVVKNTKLEKDFIEGKFKPLTLEEAVCLTKDLTEIYLDNGIRVIRMGLQSTDTITRSGKDCEVVGGPYHECFGELVEGKALVDEIVYEVSDFIKKQNTEIINFLNINVTENKMPTVSGYKQENILKIRDLLNIRHIKVLPTKKTILSVKDPCYGKICRVVSIKKEDTFVDRNESNKKGNLASNISIELAFNRLL